TGFGRDARSVVAVVAGVGRDERVVRGRRLAGQVGRQGGVGHHVRLAAGGLFDDRRVVDERVVPGGVAVLVRVGQRGGGRVLAGHGHAVHVGLPRLPTALDLVGDAAATVGPQLLEGLAQCPVLAVGVEQRRRRLPTRHGDVVVGADVADAVVVADEGALAAQRLEIRRPSALRRRVPRGVVVLVLEDDREDVVVPG